MDGHPRQNPAYRPATEKALETGLFLFGGLPVLVEKIGWSENRADEYCKIIRDLAVDSGGGEVTPNVIVIDCMTDPEDNRILELVATVRASILVTSDIKDLVSMSPWNLIPILTPEAFSKREEVRLGKALRASHPSLPRRQ